MQQLNTFVDMVVAQVRDQRITVGRLRASLLQDGMDAEEITLLLEVVALEVRLTKPPTFAMVRAAKVYKSDIPQRPRLVDVVG